MFLTTLNKYKNFSWSFTYISVELSLFMMVSLHAFLSLNWTFWECNRICYDVKKKIEEKKEREGRDGEKKKASS